MGTICLRECAARTCLLFLIGLFVVPGSGVADEELDFGLEKREIERLTFEGNTAWSDDDLKSLLSIEGSPWYFPWRPDRYRLDGLEQGIQALRQRAQLARVVELQALLTAGLDRLDLGRDRAQRA